MKSYRISSKLIEKFNVYICHPILKIELHILPVEIVGDETVAFLSSSTLREPNSYWFPYLNKIATNVCGVPASSDDIEGAFGTALDILSV